MRDQDYDDAGDLLPPSSEDEAVDDPLRADDEEEETPRLHAVQATEPLRTYEDTNKPGGAGAAHILGRQTIDVKVDGKVWKVIVPERYEIWQNGLYSRKDLSRFDTSWPIPDLDLPAPRKHLVELTKIANRPIFVSRSGFRRDWDRHDGEAMVELRWRRTDGRWASRWVPALELSTRNKVAGLIEFDCPVNSENGAAVLLFIAAMQSENPEHAGFSVLTRGGYYEMDGGPCWLLGRQWIGPIDARIAVDGNLSPLAEAYTPSGTFAEWIEAVSPFLFGPAYAPLTRWVLATTFVPPILSVLESRTFGVHLYADTKVGKTALALLSLSAWGDTRPTRLKQTFNATQGGITGIYEQEVSHLPFVVDELQVAGDIRTSDLAYALSLESGRRRLTREGKTQRQSSSYRAVLLTTGEESLIDKDRRDAGGVATRILELVLNAQNAMGETRAKSVYRFLQKRKWGTAGPAFLRALRTKLLQNPDLLRRISDEFREELSLQIEDDTAVDWLATIATAEYLMLYSLFRPEDGTPKAARLRAIEDAFFVYRTYIAVDRADTARSQRDKALDYLRDHLVSFPQCYADLSTEEGQKKALFGPPAGKPLVAIIAAGEIVYVRKQLELLLKQEGFSFRRVWNDLRAKKLICADEGHFTCNRSNKPWLRPGRYPVLFQAALLPDEVLPTSTLDISSFANFTDQVSLDGIDNLDENAGTDASYDPSDAELVSEALGQDAQGT